MSNPRSQLSRQDRDLATLTVLALLTTGPRHPYEMHRFVVDTRKDFVTGLPRSIYHAVDKVERAGLVAAVGTDRAPGRPARTVYELTEPGRAELRRRVGLLLATPDPDATLGYAALSYLGVLEPETALSALGARIANLDWQLTALQEDLDEARRSGVAALLLVEVDHRRQLLLADRDFTVDLVARLRSGELPWPGAAGDGADPTS